MSSTDQPNTICIYLHGNASLHCHTDEEVENYFVYESKVHNRSEDVIASVNDLRESLECCGIRGRSPESFTNPMPAVYADSVMDPCGIDIDNLRAIPPTFSDCSSNSLPRGTFATFEQGIIELRHVLDASALVLDMGPHKEKQMDGAFGHVEVTAASSNLDDLESRTDKPPATQTTPDRGPETRSVRSQAGSRSRFKPWGYI